jgi:hypothetical protein
MSENTMTCLLHYMALHSGRMPSWPLPPGTSAILLSTARRQTVPMSRRLWPDSHTATQTYPYIWKDTVYIFTTIVTISYLTEPYSQLTIYSYRYTYYPTSVTIWCNIALNTLRHGLSTVCVPFRGWMFKTKDVSTFEQGTVVGARCTGLNVSRTATLLGFSRSTVSRVYQEWSTTQKTSSQLDTTVGSIGVNMGQHPCGTHSTTCRVHVWMNWGCSEGKTGCNSILLLLLLLMFCTLSDYIPLPLGIW